MGNGFGVVVDGVGNWVIRILIKRVVAGEKLIKVCAGRIELLGARKPVGGMTRV
jgi:hypothetical protein